MTRTDIINRLIKERGYSSYLEIGVENPSNNYNLINCKYKESVDPYVENFYISDQDAAKYADAITYKMPSDKFFSIVNKKYDIVFIDGMHTEQQCDKDIYNAMQHLTEYGCVVIHDCLPLTADMQTEKPKPGGHPWTGTVWKSILKLVRLNVPVNVLDYDYGVAIIEKCSYIMPCIDDNMTYEKDFKKSDMRIKFTISSYNNVISYFTPLYNTTREMILRNYKSLQKQTDQKWEWVLLADSLLGNDVLAIIMSIVHCDYRVKYYNIKHSSCGFIGEAKYRASMLCRGYLVAELDHDDMIMPRLTEYLRKAAAKFPEDDFFYTDTIEVGANLKSIERYPDGFAMGYGKYYTVTEIKPVTGKEQEFDVIRQPDINPATMRHIVGVPNHVRCWRRQFLMAIGSYNRSLPIADDYELLVRTFLNTKMCRIAYAGYIQIMHYDNTQNKARHEIQQYVHAIANTYHKDIAYRFEQCGVHDWIYSIQPDSADECWNFSDGSILDHYNDVFEIQN